MVFVRENFGNPSESCNNYITRQRNSQLTKMYEKLRILPDCDIIEVVEAIDETEVEKH